MSDQGPDFTGVLEGGGITGGVPDDGYGLGLTPQQNWGLDRMGGSAFTAEQFQLVRIPFGRLQGSGSGNLGRYDLRSALRYTSMLDTNRLQQIQQMLWYAGYYGEEAVRNGAQPLWGDNDEATQVAWLSLIQDSIRLGGSGGGKRLDQLIADRTELFAPVIDSAVDLEPMQDRTITLEDPASIRQWLDDNAPDIIGQGVDDATKEMMVQLIHRRQTEQQQAQIGVDQTNEAEQKGYNEANPALPTAMGMFPRQFGPNQVAEVASQIAGRYGLTVGGQWRTKQQNFAIYGYERDSDHIRGMALDISGSQEGMAALGAWAKANEGPGKLFRWVGWQSENHYDHVHLSFNETNDGNIMAEGISVNGEHMLSQAGGTDAIDRFMAAIRSVESSGNYEAYNNSFGARGAYQFIPDTWRGVNREFGGDASDWSPQNQDNMARRKMLQYFNQFGDWQSVAVAWFAGPGRVAAFRAGQAGSMSDGNTTVPKYVEKVMGLMGDPGIIGPSGAVSNITAVDPASLLEQELKDRFPTETAAHDIAGTFDDFVRMIGSGSGGSSNLSSPSIGAGS